MLEGLDWTQIATVPAVIALVNVGKRLGIHDKAALVLAIVLGVVLHLAVYLWGATGWFPVVATGLITGLAAAGIWDVFVPSSKARVSAASRTEE